MNSDLALTEAILDSELRHINFFNGRLLTGGDLQAEQTVQHAHARQIGKAIGPGVAFGLEVTPLDGSPPGSPAVLVAAGLAVSRAGQTLRLECNQRIALIRPPDAASADACVFGNCDPTAAGSMLPTGTGFYVLTIAPASRPEGKAPVSGLGNGFAGCNSRFLAEGVMFRLLRLNISPGAAAAQLRSAVARECFGLQDVRSSEVARRAFHQLAPAAYGFTSRIPTGQLNAGEVPLAVIEWKNSGLGFVDTWCVRRRLARPAGQEPWRKLMGDERWAESEAVLQQFQAHLLAVLGEPAPRPRSAHERFLFLPPAALLPVGAGQFTWKDFLGVHAPAIEIPLNEGLARSLIRHSLDQDPVEVVPPGPRPAGSAAPVPFHVYRVEGLQDIVLIARSSLGEVVADDVTFDNTTCQLPNAPTVQRAIEELCKERGCCAVTVTPGAGWETVLTGIRAGQDAHVCFQPGEYRLDRVLQLRGIGHLVITGAGRGTRIVVARSEAALMFTGCKSVSVSNLAVESGAASSKGDAAHLNGALTFVDCPAVEIDALAIRCPAAAIRTSACLVVRNTFENATLRALSAARVRRCEFEVGHQQVGVLLVNVARVTVEDNVLRAGAAPTWQMLVQNLASRARLRENLISSVGPAATARNATVTSGAHTISFRTAGPLAGAWSKALAAARPPGISNTTQLAALIERLADEFLLKGGNLAGMSPGLLSKAFGKGAERTTPAGNQGIVIGGRTASDVRVLNNTIVSFMQGIHIGLSHEDPERRAPDRAGAILITGNTIQIRLAADSARERHAIFVGNCESLVIENNYATLSRVTAASRLPVEGIRIFGLLGSRIIVRANHLAPVPGSAAFDPGIRFRALNVPNPNEKRQWYLGDNLFASSPTRFHVGGLDSFFRGLDTNVA